MGTLGNRRSSASGERGEHDTIVNAPLASEDGSAKFRAAFEDLIKRLDALPADMTDGEVRKIDMEAGKVTLKHGDIKNLDMPGMTMVFVVKDKAMLDKLKTGDKVTFRVINDAGKFTVTDIQLAP